MKKALLIGAGILSALLLVLPVLWSIGLWYYQPVSIVPALLVLGGAALWWKLRNRPSIHLVLWLMVAVNIITYHCIPGPTPERWQKPWALAPVFEQQGDQLTIRNIRDFRYRTEEDSTLIHFSKVRERYTSSEWSYIVGDVKLSDLVAIKDKLAGKDIFLAAYPWD